jgi:hypothetical protein
MREEEKAATLAHSFSSGKDLVYVSFQSWL